MSDEEGLNADPITVIQNTLANLDPTSMVLGFATVVEWLEEDGSRSLSVVHTPMPPWSLYGLMTYGRDHHCSVQHAVSVFPEYELEDDDETDGDF